MLQSSTQGAALFHAHLQSDCLLLCQRNTVVATLGFQRVSLHPCNIAGSGFI